MDPRALLVAGLAVLAGCTAAPVPPPPDAAPEGSGPGVLAWDLLDCSFAYAIAAVPAERIAPLLPEGFAVRSGLPFGLGPPLPPPAPTAMANLAFEVNDCASGMGLAGRVSPMQYAHVWVGTTPPRELREEGVPMFVGFDFLVPDEDRRALLAAAGLPARAGALEVRDTPTGREVAYDLEGLGAFLLAIHDAPGDLPLQNGTVAHFVEAADGGLSKWRYDWRTHAFRSGQGTVEVPPGTWLSDLLGGTTAPVRVFHGRWDYTNGTIEVRVPQQA